MNYFEVIIIGAGPAGISAAIQLRRYGLDLVIFEKNEIGGLLKNANLVENYPGFPKGISGGSLVNLFKKQFYSHDLDILREEVIEVIQEGKQYIVTTNMGKYVSDYLVIGSGTKPKLFSKFKVNEDIRQYLHYEVYSLIDKKEKVFVVIGGGDAAFDYAINLSKNNQVIILNKNSETNSLPLLWERAKTNKSIKYYPNSEINGIKWGGNKLKVDVNLFEKNNMIEADHIVFAIGRNPDVGFLSSELQQSMEKKTEQGNIFMVGDVRNGMFRQTSISVGNGVEAAMKIYNKSRNQ